MKKIILPLLLFAFALPLSAASPLNQLDELYNGGQDSQAKNLTERLLKDSKLSPAQKNAIVAYQEIRTILGDQSLSSRKKREALDAAYDAFQKEWSKTTPCADSFYVRGLNRMFAANLVREFSSLNAITTAKDDLIRALNLDENHWGALSELGGIYGYMPEFITFGDKNCAVNLGKRLFALRGSRRDAKQLSALLLRRDDSSRKRVNRIEEQRTAFESATTAFEKAAAFEGSPEATKLFPLEIDDESQAHALMKRFSLTEKEVKGEEPWSRHF